MTTLLDPVYAGNKRAPVHRWVRWIAGFSADFAGHAIEQFIPSGRRTDALVLDPFAGVATTLVEAQRRGIPTVGFEINPFAVLAARAKLEAAKVDPGALRLEIERYAAALGKMEAALDAGESVPAPHRVAPPGFHTRELFYSPAVERKVLHSLDYIDGLGETAIADLFRLAFASTMVTYSNYTYEPSLGSRKGAKKPTISQWDVAATIAAKLTDMADDVAAYTAEFDGRAWAPGPWQLFQENFFAGATALADGSVDLVVTSPPYLNNYHYVRNTRPQMYWLNLISSPRDQVVLETESFGKYWQTVRDRPQVDLNFKLQSLADRIAELRATNKKNTYGGNGWANYAATYYNDSYRLVREVARLLRPHGGAAIIVVGNNVLQGIEFKVDVNLVEIGQLLGLEGETLPVRKTRVGSSIMGTGARQKVAQPIELYEAAVVLRHPA